MKTPPIVRESAPPPRALARVRDEGTPNEEGVIFFSVEGAPNEVCQTRSGPDGSLTFHTTIAGRVVGVETDELVIARGPHTIRIRHLLPGAVDLGELEGHAVRVEIAQCYLRAGRATIDCEIRDAHGRLILWAHDGRMPSDADSHGLAMRTLVENGATHLAVGHELGLRQLDCPGSARVRREGESCVMLLCRLGVDDISLVIVRR